MSHRILIQFAHPAPEKSRVQKELFKSVSGLEGVTVNDLYELYPEFHIHVRREQELLLAHDVLVFQHPLYWYSTPAILKEWQDLVLEHGFAYGDKGTALRGKRFLCAISAGGPVEAYAPGGYNSFTIRQLLAPLEQTAILCGMEFLEPFAVHGTHRLSDSEISDAADRYRQRIVELRDSDL